jgi:cell division protein FtsX
VTILISVYPAKMKMNSGKAVMGNVKSLTASFLKNSSFSVYLQEKINNKNVKVRDFR